VTGITLIYIPSGTFQMGSPSTEAERNADETIYTVRISHSFYMSDREVTQLQWQKVMSNNPSWFQKCGGNCPVEKVNWYQVHSFLNRLNQITHAKFRLPTEAEWEYACRAGTQTPFSTGENLSTDQANYDGDYPYRGFRKGKNRKGPIPVASFPPNRWKLFDMQGNVWEWTADQYCTYPKDEVIDPQPKCASDLKVIRGGSWYFGADSSRCALRYTHRPQDSGFSIGFRIAIDKIPVE